jgi:tetratricopeptide (TPR) repeat protein
MSSDARRRLERRHSQLMQEAALRAHTASTTDEQIAAFSDADLDLADLRIALERSSRAGDWRVVSRIASRLAPYWYSRYLAWEGRQWLDAALEHDIAADELESLLHAAGYLAWATHDYDAADRHYRAYLAHGDRQRDQRIRAAALLGLGTVHQKRRFVDGAAFLEEAIAIYEQWSDVDAELGECYMFRGLDEAYNGSTARGIELLSAAVERFDRVGHLRQVSKSRRWLAHCAWRESRADDARRHAHEAARIASETGDRVALSGALIERAYVEMTWGDPKQASVQLVDALEPIPRRDQIDLCQVLLPAARLAALTGAESLAVRALTCIDDVYERCGWKPLRAAAAARQLHDALTRGGPAEAPTLERTLDDVVEHLASVANSWSGGLGHPALARPPG